MKIKSFILVVRFPSCMGDTSVEVPDVPLVIKLQTFQKFKFSNTISVTVRAISPSPYKFKCTYATTNALKNKIILFYFIFLFKTRFFLKKTLSIPKIRHRNTPKNAILTVVLQRVLYKYLKKISHVKYTVLLAYTTVSKQFQNCTLFACESHLLYMVLYSQSEL